MLNDTNRYCSSYQTTKRTMLYTVFMSFTYFVFVSVSLKQWITIADAPKRKPPKKNNNKTETIDLDKQLWKENTIICVVLIFILWTLSIWHIGPLEWFFFPSHSSYFWSFRRAFHKSSVGPQPNLYLIEYINCMYCNVSIYLIYVFNWT